MRCFGLITILSFTIAGCTNTANIQLSESLQTAKVPVAREYSDIVINNALRATCFDIKDIYPAFGCSPSKKDTSTQFSVYDLVSDFDSDDGGFFYTRNIVKIEKKYGHSKRVVDYKPYLGGELAKGLKIMLPKYDSLLKSNLEKQQERYDAGINLKHSSIVDDFININSSFMPKKYLDKNSLDKGVDEFYRDKTQFNYIYSKETFVGEYENSNRLRDHDFFIDKIYLELKKKLISSIDSPVKIEYCNENGNNLKLCKVSSSPFEKSIKFTDQNITLAAYYRYSNPFGYVVRIKNNTNGYIKINNSDVLFIGKYYPVKVNGASLPPKSEREFEVITPRRFHPYVKATSRDKVIDYGIVAQYEVEGRTKTVNKTLKYSPFAPLYE